MKRKCIRFFLMMAVLCWVLCYTSARADIVSGQAIVDFARQYIGKVPYVDCGTRIDGSRAGADCSGFLCAVYGKFGINLWKNRAGLIKYGVEPYGVLLENEVNQLKNDRDASGFLPGDILIFRFIENGKTNGHVGIYSGNGNLIHCASNYFVHNQNGSKEIWHGTMETPLTTYATGGAVYTTDHALSADAYRQGLIGAVRLHSVNGHSVTARHAMEIGNEGYGEYAVGESTWIELECEDDSVLEGISSVTLCIYYTPDAGSESILYKTEEIAVKKGESIRSSYLDLTDVGYYSACFHVDGLTSSRTSWRVRDIQTVVSASYGSNATTTQGERYDGHGNFIGYYQSITYHFVAGETVRYALNTSEYTSAHLYIQYRAPGNGPTEEVFNGIVDPNTFELTLEKEGVYWGNYTGIGPYMMVTESVNCEVLSADDFPVTAERIDKHSFLLSWPDMGVNGYGYKSYGINAFASFEPWDYVSGTNNLNQLSYLLELPSAGLWDVYVEMYKGSANNDHVTAADIIKGHLTLVCEGNTVSFDANGGTGTPLSQETGAGNDTVELPSGPTRPGYVFMGWSTTAGASAPAYQPGDNFTVTEDSTLYAVWERPNPDFILPAGTVIVEDSAFQGCAFTCVQLSEETVTLGNSAFADCSRLKHVYMTPSVTDIGSSVFPAGITIHGQKGSYAEFYAESNGYGFCAE